jgi:hypothetical protein
MRAWETDRKVGKITADKLSSKSRMKMGVHLANSAVQFNNLPTSLCQLVVSPTLIISPGFHKPFAFQLMQASQQVAYLKMYLELYRSFRDETSLFVDEEQELKADIILESP